MGLSRVVCGQVEMNVGDAEVLMMIGIALGYIRVGLGRWAGGHGHDAKFNSAGKCWIKSACLKGVMVHNNRAVCCQEQFPDLTKEQLGRDLQERCANECQWKSLQRGLSVKQDSWMSVSSREKNNTKRN